MQSADVENHLEAQTEVAWDGKQRQQRRSPGEVPGQDGDPGRLKLIVSGQLDCFRSYGQPTGQQKHLMPEPIRALTPEF